MKKTLDLINFVENECGELREKLDDYYEELNKNIQKLENLEEIENPMGVYLVCSEHADDEYWWRIRGYFDKFTSMSYQKRYAFDGRCYKDEKCQICKKKSFIKVVSDKNDENSILYIDQHPIYGFNGYGMCELSEEELRKASNMIYIDNQFSHYNVMEKFNEEMMKDFESTFKQFKPYLNFTVASQINNTINIGVGGYDNKGPHLYFGYMDFYDLPKSEIIFSNEIGVLAEFCSEIYEMKKNTYCQQKIHKSEHHDKKEEVTFYEYQKKKSDFVPCSMSNVIKKCIKVDKEEQQAYKEIKKKLDNIYGHIDDILNDIIEINSYSSDISNIEDSNSDNISNKGYVKHISSKK